MSLDELLVVASAWREQAVRFIEQASKRDARLTAEERRTLLDFERVLVQRTRGFYGWGFVDRNPLRRAGSGGRRTVRPGRRSTETAI